MSIYRFGPFAVHAEEFTLARDGSPVEITAVPLALLILLLRNRGGLLPREAIARTIWPQADPADLTHRINMAINRIRTTLGDDPADPIYIQTVIGKGYRFIGQVEEVEDAAPAAAGEGRRKVWLAWGLCLALLLAAPFVWRWRHAVPSPAEYFRLTQVTFNQSEDHVTAAAISPDGKWIAYADADGVRLKQPAQADSQPVPTPPRRVVYRLAWFSDQQHLALSGVDGQTNKPEIWLLSVAGGAPLLLRKDARFATPAPFGTRIAFTDAANSAVWCQDDLSHPPRLILQGAVGDTFPVLAWSPNGKTLLLGRYQTGPQVETPSSPSGIAPKWSYVALDSDTGTVSATVDDFMMSEAMASPSGTLLFSREQPNGLGFWTVPINTTTGALLAAPQKRQVTGKDTRSLSLSASGRFAAIVRTVIPRIAVGRFQLAPPRITDIAPLSFSTNETYPHSWTADSSSLYFEEHQGDHYRLLRQQVGMHDAVALTPAPNDQAFPLLAPGRPYLLFIGRDKKPDPWELYRLPLSGGAAELVDTKGPMGEMRCPLRSSSCFLRRVEDKQRVVFYRLDPVSGLGPAVYSLPWTSDDLGAWNISPDGTKLVLGSPHAEHAQLRIIELSTGAVQTVPVGIAAPIWNVEWVAGGSGWFLSIRTFSGGDLYYAAPDGKATLLRQTTSNSWIVPAPDGQKVAFIDQRVDSNVWISTTALAN